MELVQRRHCLLAVTGATLPPLVLLVWMRLIDQAQMTLTHMLVYPLVFGGGAIVLIAALNRFLCRSSLAGFNRTPGRWTIDLGQGLLLLIVFIALAIIQQFTTARWFPREGPVPEIIDLMRSLSQNPLLLVIWLGPVVWIGVALFEELFRTFFLKTLWEVWPSAGARWLVLIFSALLIGGVHAYQGINGVISTGIMGLISGWFYLRRGRLLPLVVAHAVYDSAWIIFGVIMIRG